MKSWTFPKHLFLRTSANSYFWQCCPNTTETALRRKSAGAMLAQTTYRSSHWRCSVKKCVLRICTIHYSQENTCVGVFKKETLVQMFSCEFCKISKNAFSYRKPPVACFCLGQHCIRKLPMECWPMAKVQRLWEDNVYNVVSTMLEQHCIRTLFSQWCSNTSETTLHKKYWLKAQRYTFAGKSVVLNMSGGLF